MNRLPQIGDEIRLTNQCEALIIFTRVPIPGITKTRLQKLLTTEECASLHCCFLLDQKNLCEKLGRDYFVFYSPEGAGEGQGQEEQLVRIFGEEVPLYLQQGEGLGDRMLHAITSVLAMGYDACALMGSDIPELQIEELTLAFEVLEERDIVLGPTKDLGYYLVGMKKSQSIVFEKQIYGYGDVLENTIRAIEDAGLTYGLIKMHEDIDEPEDILSFQRKVDSGQLDNKLNTAKFILQLIQKYNGSKSL